MSEKDTILCGTLELVGTVREGIPSPDSPGLDVGGWTVLDPGTSPVKPT